MPPLLSQAPEPFVKAAVTVAAAPVAPLGSVICRETQPVQAAAIGTPGTAVQAPVPTL